MKRPIGADENLSSCPRVVGRLNTKGARFQSVGLAKATHCRGGAPRQTSMSSDWGMPLHAFSLTAWPNFCPWNLLLQWSSLRTPATRKLGPLNTYYNSRMVRGPNWDPTLASLYEGSYCFVLLNAPDLKLPYNFQHVRSPRRTRERSSLRKSLGASVATYTCPLRGEISEYKIAYFPLVSRPHEPAEPKLIQQQPSGSIESLTAMEMPQYFCSMASKGADTL